MVHIAVMVLTISMKPQCGVKVETMAKVCLPTLKWQKDVSSQILIERVTRQVLTTLDK